MGTRQPLSDLPRGPVRIAPSILAADFSCLGDEIAAVARGGADMVHVDVMDGHFVPNISIGPPVVRCVRAVTELPLDVHLMLSDPGDYIPAFLDAGADHITIHVESNGDLDDLLDRIHEAGASAGMTLRPGTSEETLAPFLRKLDMILVMTVEPGFGGQSFMADQLPKIRTLRRMIDASGRHIHLEADGGLNRETAPLVIEAGVDVLVAGSSVFRDSAGAAAAIAALRG